MRSISGSYDPNAIFLNNALLGHLRAVAQRQPQSRAYTYLANGEREHDHRSFAGLDQRARAIAMVLRKHAQPGDRALIVLPNDLSYMDAFFGCLYAGIIAVPLSEVTPRTAGKVALLAKDAEPRLLLAHSRADGALDGLAEQLETAHGTARLSTDRIADEEGNGWTDVVPDINQPAYIQYTAGSTVNPRGALIRYSNLLDNLRVLTQRLDADAQSVCVTWLPLFHDMGLVIGALVTVYSGGHTVMMTPQAFIERPRRWLDALSRYQGTVSAAPNFAYTLCVDRISEAERANLNLSRWRSAINGAEPVHPVTLDRFAQAFAPSGFQPEALCPGYGLAESTVAVSLKKPGRPILKVGVDKTALAAHKLVPRPASDLVLVGCGAPLSEVVIVDPECYQRCEPHQIGEIWARSPSVAAGYWLLLEESAAVFNARLATGDGPFLRTGDLGFLYEGELFITGRIKDLVIIRGKNHYPSDLEHTAAQSHPALRPVGAAFSVEVEGDAEQLVIVQEVRREAQPPYEEIALAVRQQIARNHELSPQAVVLVPAGALPKTTSGKIQRRACKARYLAGQLGELLLHPLSSAATEAEPQRSDAASTPQEAEVLGFLHQELARLLKVKPTAIDLGQNLVYLGLDSLLAVELKGLIEVYWGVSVPVPALIQTTNTHGLCSLVLTEMQGGRS